VAHRESAWSRDVVGALEMCGVAGKRVCSIVAACPVCYWIYPAKEASTGYQRALVLLVPSASVRVAVERFWIAAPDQECSGPVDRRRER
jgi:hypothetical protein